MKYLIIFVLGVCLGIYVDRHPPSLQLGGNPKVREQQAAARDEFADKMRQWRLTPDDIKSELAHTGEIVRTQANAVGGKISDARILAVVKAKYILDRDLSASGIHVAVLGGRVTLTGSAGSADLVGRAMALAMDTDGVTAVDSKLGVVQT
jgi:osmotically-inducible protein OsmY